MTTTELTISRERMIEDVRSLSTADLWSRFTSVLETTAESLTRLAVIAQELHRRGEDISGIRSGLASYLPMIASGKMSAEAVVKFAGQRAILNIVGTLPIETQISLAQGTPVQLVALNSRGEYETVSKPVHELTIPQVRLAFDSGRLRSTGEQKQVLEGLRKRAEMRRRTPRVARTITGRFERIETPRDAIDHALAELPKVGDGGGEKIVPLKLTLAEHAALKAEAASRGVSMQALLRAAMAAAGLI